jgi:hypothetical protein
LLTDTFSSASGSLESVGHELIGQLGFRLKRPQPGWGPQAAGSYVEGDRRPWHDRPFYLNLLLSCLNWHRLIISQATLSRSKSSPQYSLDSIPIQTGQNTVNMAITIPNEYG